MNNFCILGIAAFLSALGTWFFIGFGRRLNLLDNPNHRSSHKVPVPRGGGLVFVTLSLLGFSLFYFFDRGSAGISLSQQALVLGFAGAVAIISLADDAFSLPILPRLLVQLLVALLSTYFCFSEFFGNSSWSLLLYLILPFLIVWSINLFNFMDGMDGIAGTEALFVFTATGLFIYLDSGQFPEVLSLLAGSLIGFLVFNKPLAKVFMGDVGSCFLGYLVFCLPLIYFLTLEIHPLMLLILYGSFWSDATVTLGRRFFAGDTWRSAHKKHLYQRLHHGAGWSHRKVLAFYSLLNLVLLVIALLFYLGKLGPVTATIFTVTLLSIWQLFGNLLAPFRADKPKKVLRILIINEFFLGGSPVAKLVYDLNNHLNTQASFKSSIVYISKKYKPGGLGRRRISNMLLLNILLPFIVFLNQVRACSSGAELLLIPTTNPPLIHWASLFWGRLFGARTIIWYQDAHPDYEVSYLEGRGWWLVSKVFKKLDSYFLGLAEGAILLDQSMLEKFSSKLSTKLAMVIAPPWTTYTHPAVPVVIQPIGQGPLKLIYAGNYGAAHDLNPFANYLKQSQVIGDLAVELTFVGMSSFAQSKLQSEFAEVPVRLVFLDRYANAADLFKSFPNYHFGIVSLAEQHLGLSCPSKSYSYLSQGLFLFYIGPEGTLADDLVQKGWGLKLNQHLSLVDQLTAFGKPTKAATIFEDPTASSLAVVTQMIRQSRGSSL